MFGWLVGCAAGTLQLEVTVDDGAGVLSDEVARSATVVDDGGCDEILVDDLPWSGTPITQPLLTTDLTFAPGSGFVTTTEATGVCTKGGSGEPVVASTTFTVLPGLRSDALDDGEIADVLVRDGSRLVGCGAAGDVVERDLTGGPAVHLDLPCGPSTRIEAQSAAVVGGFVVRNDLGGSGDRRVTWVWRPPSSGSAPEVLYDHVLGDDDAVFANVGVILRERGGERVATLIGASAPEELTLGPAADWPPEAFAGRSGSDLTFVDEDGLVRTHLSPAPRDLGVRRTPGTHLYYGYTGSDVYQLVDDEGAFVILRNGRVEHRVPGARVAPIPGAPWGAFVTDADGVTWLAWGSALERRAPAGISVEYGNDDHWFGVTDDGDAVVGWLDRYGVLTDGLFDGSRLLPTLPLFPASRLSVSDGWAIRDGVPYEISLLQIAEVAGP